MNHLLLSLKMRLNAYHCKWMFYTTNVGAVRLMYRQAYAVTADSHNAICPKWLPKIRARIAA